MKRTLLSAIFAGLVGLASVSYGQFTYDGQINLLDNQPYHSGVGGEFQANIFDINTTPVTGYSVANQSSLTELPSQSSVANLSTTSVFQTFCIQEGPNPPGHDVTFNPGTTYSAFTGTYAYFADGSHETLSSITKVLYAQFWNGTLTNYNFTDSNVFLTGLSRTEDAGALQAAIWVAQGNNDFAGAESDAGIGSDVLADAQAVAFYNAALAVGNNLTSDEQEVAILELDSDSATPPNPADIAQAQLIELPPGGLGTPPFTPLPPALYGGMALLAVVGLNRLSNRYRHVD